MFYKIRTYDVKLPHGTQSKPTSYRKAGNSEQTQWFHAEDKERDGILESETWIRLPQEAITPAIRKKALRAHHIYDIKRDMSSVESGLSWTGKKCFFCEIWKKCH
jgi:hypothetical protein